MQMEIVLKAVDQARRTLEEAKKQIAGTGTEADKARKRFDSLNASAEKFVSTGKKIAVVGGAITSAYGMMAREAMKFNKGVAEMSTLMPEKSLAQVKSEFGPMLLETAREFAQGTDIVVKAAYDSVSAGVAPTKEAVKEFLAVAGDAAIGGVTTMATAVDGITSVVNAYGPEVMKATDAADSMFAAVKAGKTTFDELAQNLSNVTPTAAAIGIKFTDVTAAIAAMTKQGTKTPQATTKLNAMFAELDNRGSQVGKTFKKLTGEHFADFIKKGGDVAGSLNTLNEHAEKNGMSIKNLFSGLEAGAAAVQLAGQSANIYSEALEEQRKRTGALAEASAKMKADSAFQFERSIAGIKTTAIALGENLLPAITDGANALSRFLGHINKFISENPKAAATIIKLTAGLGAFMTIGGSGMIVGGKLVQTANKIGMAYSTNAPKIKDAVKGFLDWNAAGRESIMKAGSINLNFKNIGKGLKNISSSAWGATKSITSGFVGSVKGAPGAILKTTAAIASQTKALLFSKAGWMSMGGALKGGVAGAFKALIFPIKAVSTALLTNPIGLIALGIAGAALLLYKYWKPIKNFFKGVFSGIMTGLSPLKESFSGVIQPLSSIWGWFKKLIEPVEATGKSFSIGADLGFAIGTAMGFVATAIGKVVKAFVWFVTAPSRLLAAVAAFKNAGMSLPKAIWEGIKETASMPINAIKEMVGKIREFLPFSPAKVGPLKDLNKVKIVETIAGTIKPEPVRDAMQKVTGQISGASPSRGGAAAGSSGSVIVHYSPTITIGSGTKEDIAGFSEMLNRHKDELLKIIDEATRKKMRLAY